MTDPYEDLNELDTFYVDWTQPELPTLRLEFKEPIILYNYDTRTQTLSLFFALPVNGRFCTCSRKSCITQITSNNQHAFVTIHKK